jgi:ElaB/YqjD/DUF883 family membrane-anchored ribosome-binding protein
MTLLEKNAAKLADDLKNVVRDAEELVKSIPGGVSDKAREAKERLVQTVDNAKATCRRLEEKAVEEARIADKFVHERPYHFIGAAFGLGMLIALLVNRK